MKKTLFSVLLIIFALFMFGFNTPSLRGIAGEQDNAVQILTGQTFGQSFTSLHAGLDGVNIDIIPPDQESNKVIVRLYENALNRRLIFEEDQFITYQPDQISYRIDLDLQKDSYLRDYFLEIEWHGDRPLIVLTAPADSYDQGAFYLGESPLEAQLGFILHYDGFFKILGLAKQSLIWLWYLELTSLAFILPGWALLLLTWRSWKKYRFLVKAAMSAGVSFAVYPLLLLLTDFVGFHPGELFYVWVPVFLGSGYLIWQNREDLQRIYKQPQSLLTHLKKFVRAHFSWLNLTTLVVVLSVIVLRLWIIRTLTVPLWGDSYQHTVITQLILDNKGLFESWLPYAPYESLSIHFGFHVNSAIFAWISNSSASYAVIWMGQIANIFAVLALYPLARQFSKDNKWLGCCVIFVAGLLLKLPMFYVNWGRYPQLIALSLMPIAFFMILEIVFSSDREIKKIFTTSFILAGMALCYYRSPLFMLIFLPIFITEITKWLKKKTKNKSIWLWKALLLLFLTITLLIPIIPRLSQGELVESVGYKQTSPLNNQFKTIISGWQSVTNYYHWILLILATLAVAFAIITKQWEVSLMPLGVFLLQSYGLGTLINLPFSNFSNVFSILILLYIPLAILIGYLISEIKQFLIRYSDALPALVIIITSLILVYSHKNLLDKKSFEYVTWSDQRAFEWIKNNVDESSLFLVDGFNIYDGTSSVGSDGGWWIPLLAERDNTMPPQYAMLNESPIKPGYSKEVVEIINTFSQTDPTTTEGFSAMCKWGISHIYIGQKQGLMNQAEPLLKWKTWQEVPFLDLIYAEDRVRIFTFDRSICQ
ncbi:MAG: hypothetical protein ACP5D6_09010 [Kosmotogaceae bacterium]